MVRTLNPELVSLSRRQLDAKLQGATAIREFAAAQRSWITAIRTALGMTADQLGKRLGMSRQGATALERREADGTITLAKLREAANALECDAVVVFVPREPLEVMVQRQARTKAKAERNRLVHTMRLEAQESGVESALDPEKASRAWLTTRLRELWSS